MKTLTLIFYAATTFLLGVIAVSSIPIALASAMGNQQAELIQDLALVVTVVAPLVFIGAIPFAGTRRGE